MSPTKRFNQFRYLAVAIFLLLAAGILFFALTLSPKSQEKGTVQDSSESSVKSLKTSVHRLVRRVEQSEQRIRAGVTYDVLRALGKADNSSLMKEMTMIAHNRDGIQSGLAIDTDFASMVEEDAEKYPNYVYPPLARRNPKQYFGRRLPDTEERKAAIDKFFKDYVQLHQDILQGKRERKFVVVGHYTEAGFGNLLPVMASAFIFAVASDRAFLVDWPYQRPRQHFNGLEHVGYPDIKELMEEPPGMAWRYDELKKLPDEKSTDVNPVEKDFVCKDPKSFSDPIIRIKYWDFFGPMVAYNSYFYEKLHSTFGDDWFGPIIRWLIRPIPPLRTEINQFIERHFASKFVVGLQIRKGGLNGLSDAKENRFFTCADVVASSQNVDNDKVAYFIAADNKETRDRAVQNFGDKAIILSSEVSRSSTRGVQEGLLDALLLASCDDIIESGGSTYGRLAAGYASFPAMAVMRLKELCIRQAAYMPCMYAPMDTSCAAASSWMLNYERMDDIC